MVIVLPNRDCLVYRWLYRGSYINMTDKCTGWAIVTTTERPDGTWYTETITDVDKQTASYVDDFLTEYYEDKEKSKHHED